MAHIRWMIRADMKQVQEIEQACFGDLAMSKRELTESLRARNVIGMVVEDDFEITGYCIYSLQKTFLLLEHIVAAYKREGIGTMIVDKLKQKLETDKKRRSRLVTIVNERNVPAQLFLKSCGFVCNRVSRDGYESIDGTWEDAYAFDYAIAEAVEVSIGKN